MLFPTVDFGLFFIAIFATSWALSERLEARKLLLLAASYFFYAMWDWRFMALLAGSSMLNYVAGRMIADSDDDRRRRLIVGLAIVGNLGVLGVFKYYEFFITSLGDMLRTVGFERDLPLFEIILPVGISFFTFQGISYVMDVYRRQIEPVAKISDLFLFISFFPQLVAGPIVRAADFLPQLQQRPSLDNRAIAFGFTLIVFGLFKKVVLATYLAVDLVDDVFLDPTYATSADLLFAAYAFAIQVYLDFSAYSDIAIGVAALLGYTFKKNFDRPFAAPSLEALWRRWHISLSSFLRDYLYKNLRGDRAGGKAAIYRATFLTMVIGGLWHGAAWTFVLWGALHGAFLVLERIVKAATKPMVEGGRAMFVGTPFARAPLVAIFGWLFAFHVFAILAVFFRAPDLSVVWAYYGQMLSFTPGFEYARPFVLALVVFCVLVQFLPRDLAEKVGLRLQWLPGPVAGVALGLAIVLIYELSLPGVAPFIYFQF